MKQRTPLQRVLDWVDENKKQIETAHTTLDFVSVRDLRAFIESIKEEEKEIDDFKRFANWVIINKRSIFINADISKESKGKIMNALGYSANSLDD